MSALDVYVAIIARQAAIEAVNHMYDDRAARTAAKPARDRLEQALSNMLEHS